MESTRVYDKSRLDVLIYAQDGRGVGHVSRSVAIGMALRRRYSDKKVLLMTGYRHCQMLIGDAPLDWLKLPAYETLIIDGKAKGKKGETNLKNCYLGPARSYLLKSVIEEMKPRVILVDHLPMGRRDELVASLNMTAGTDTKWLLGVRAYPGNDKVFWSDDAREVFAEHYSSLLWYGNLAIPGKEQRDRLAAHFNTNPADLGYVSRLLEMQHWQPATKTKVTGVFSLPWLSESSIKLLGMLMHFLQKRAGKNEFYRIYTQTAELEKRAPDLRSQLEELPNCDVCQASNSYFQDLQSAKLLVCYGGYNSLCDILATNVPAVVILRDMQDQEQADHVQRLQEEAAGLIIGLPEQTLEETELHENLISQLQHQAEPTNRPWLTGAERAAEYIVSILG
ncbi:MAG: glycosyltransferase [Desulfocapsaceae bacterium]|nr:glycosyltransferase [Desulfocapsaceae bacterium]